jgi:hypothetical protein
LGQKGVKMLIFAFFVIFALFVSSSRHAMSPVLNNCPVVGIGPESA